MAQSLFRYVALGDSTGAGVGSALDGGYPERLYRLLKSAGVRVGIVNLAASGATTEQLLAQQLPRARELRPNLVTVGIGANDVWRMVPEEVFAANIQRLAEGLQATKARVLVNNLPDLTMAPVASMVETYLHVPATVIEERLARFNVHLDVLSSRPGFTVLDVFSQSRTDAREGKDCFCADGFHPSPAAYDRWAEHLFNVVRDQTSVWAERWA